ncbi:MAG: hypothetical protein ACK5AZ_07970 [Bryobacteraceae bacterium]
MNFESKTTQQSKLEGFQGVSFTVNKLTEGVRIQLRLKLADALARLRDIEAEREEFFESLAQGKGKPFEEIRVSELTAKERRVLDGFNDRIDIINETEVNPAYFQAGFVSVEGLEIDGTKPDAETLRKAGPPALYREILAAIFSNGGLTAEEKENLESPSTSGAAVDGQTSSTNAPSAESTASMSDATVESISPAL